MTLRYKLLLLLTAVFVELVSQSTIDEVLASVQTNNKTLQSAHVRSEANMTLYRTGLTLPDPELTFDWMKGFPSLAGNQTDLTIAQAFDFPTAYKFRREIAQFRNTQSSLEIEIVRKDILHETRLICLHLVYLNKRKGQLSGRMERAQEFHENYRKKLEQQDATILDVNKARLLLMNTRTDLEFLEAEVTEYLERLSELNGGIAIDFNDTVYPPVAELPGFAFLEQAIEESDPELQFLEVQRQIEEAQAGLTRSLLLPKIEAGYRYQGLAGQQFHGIHTGVRVPLWENKKRTDHAAMEVKANDARIEEHRTKHFQEIRRLYERHQALLMSFDEYLITFEQISGEALLDKALEAGQITVLEYFVETMLFYESADRYLEIEEARYRLWAELMKYQL